MAELTFNKKVNPLILSQRALRRRDIYWIIPFLLTAVFPIFWQLTSLPIRQWDEARLAVNAAEMLENGNLIVTYFQGQPDMWNTKPPLQVWLIALSIKAFGYTEFAVRLPSALAVMATMGLLFGFCQRVFRSNLIAALSVLVLASSQGYMGYHVARNGDYDATLVFFITLYALSFFLFLEDYKVKYLWVCFLGVTLAVLTKGVAGLMCMPALFLYLIFRRKLLFLLKQRSFWLGCILFLVVTLGNYFLRESQNPGYLKAVYENELGGRYLSTLEQHLHPWDWYLDLMRDEKYTFWYCFLPFAVWLLFWQTSALNKRFAIFEVIFITLYMVIISSAKTKLFWYDAPVYPMAAILLGAAIGLILQLFQKSFNIKQAGLFYGIAVALIIWQPYNQILHSYLREKAAAPNWHWETMFGPVMKNLSEKYPDYKQVTFFQNVQQYNATAYFYQLAYKQKGYTFNDANENSIQDLKKGEILVVVNSDLRQRLEETYHLETLHEYHSGRAYRILEKK